MEHRFEIVDDHMMMALVDPDGYDGRIDAGYETWLGVQTEVKASPSLEQYRERFLAQMAQRTLLFWPTPYEAEWDVRVVVDAVPSFDPGKAIWQDTGPIRSTKGRLLLTTYDGLTGVARHGELQPWTAHEFSVAPGEFTCEVSCVDADRDADWVVRLTAGGDAAPWTEVAWERFHEFDHIYRVEGLPRDEPDATPATPFRAFG